VNYDTGGSRTGPDTWRRPRLLAAIAGVALLAAACSGGSPRSGSTASSKPVSSQLVAYAQCMRSHGVLNFYYSKPTSGAGSVSPALKFPGGWVVDGVDTSTQQFQSAQNTCGHLMPASAPLVASAGLLKLFITAAECMRAHGFPDWRAGEVMGLPDGTVTARVITRAAAVAIVRALQQSQRWGGWWLRGPRGLASGNHPAQHLRGGRAGARSAA
jgi:hypothetical protein